MSETDRLLARPDEYASTPLALAAGACWFDWFQREITAHDGLVRADHPAILKMLERDQSATSLRKMLRDPLGFVWRYGLGFRTPSETAEPLVMDNREYGALLHAVAEAAVKRLGAAGGVAAATDAALRAAVDAALSDVAATFESERSIPPDVIWKRTLTEVRDLAVGVVRPRDEEMLPGQMSFAEVPFARPEIEDVSGLPWDPRQSVAVPGTSVKISGAIDRLDLSGDGKIARVNDYKTGAPPKDLNFVLSGGKELQRCLYSFAVKALLGPEVTVKAALRYPRYGQTAPILDADAALKDLATYLADANQSIVSGRALPGIDTPDEYNDLSFALPANAARGYWARKEDAVLAALASVADVWEAP